MADEHPLKLNLPGLICEKLPSGNERYRVRVEGSPNRRIRLHIQPDHKQFMEHYHAARAGIELSPEPDTPADRHIRESLDWLIAKYLDALQSKVDADLASPLTMMQRRGLLTELGNRINDDGNRFGNCHMLMPTSEIYKVHEALGNTPGKADNLLKSVKAMYRWAKRTGTAHINPAEGVERYNINRGGATPWSVEDLKKYRSVHKPGTNAHLCITLFMFTACRISDAYRLGREHEFTRDGMLGLGWQPKKKGSKYVAIPMLTPLINATRAPTVQGQTYLLTEYGQPFKSEKGLANRFKKWCLEADLPNRTSHGIRKAAGKLLTEMGCTQYQVMAIHGHAVAQTSEVYTKDADRWLLAKEAMQRMKSVDW